MKKFIINSFYIMVVFSLSTSIASLGLARKVNKYRNASTVMVFTVSKEEVVVVTPVEGVIVDLPITQGQHVEQGEVVARLANEMLDAKLDALNRFAGENVSARTEAELLRAQQNAHEILAPRSGYVKSISNPQGSYVNNNSQILVIYADDNSVISTTMEFNQIQDFQRIQTINLHSERLDQLVEVEFSAVREAVGQPDGYNKYLVDFNLIDNNSAALLHQEALTLNSYDPAAPSRPSDQIADLWNRLVLAN